MGQIVMEIIIILAISIYCIFAYPVIGWELFTILVLGVILGVCRYLLAKHKKEK